MTECPSEFRASADEGTATSDVGRINRLRELLNLRATATVFGMESGESMEANEDPEDLLGRIEDMAKRMPPEEIGDPGEFKAALRTLIDHGAAALKKVLTEPLADPRSMSADELSSLEAIIIADGTRPSFLLSQGEFPLDHPFLGSWKDQMTVFRPSLRRLAACIGRIQPAGGGPANYNGTGTLVDADNCLVLTNFHVVAHARSVSGVQMEESGDRLVVRGEWFIDFAGETGSLEKNLWRIKEARLPKGVGRSFEGIDAAVLRIEPLDADQGSLPGPAVMLSSHSEYATGEGSSSLVTIGFPGEPDIKSGKGAEVDWNFVMATLFNNRFGVKRVAPGRFGLPPGSVPEDKHGLALSHDATTFGGASGSLVFAWRDEGTPAFGLHFAGATLGANYAVSMARAAAALRDIGVPIV